MHHNSYRIISISVTSWRVLHVEPLQIAADCVNACCDEQSCNGYRSGTKKKDFNVIGCDEPSRGAGGRRSHQLGTFADSDHRLMPGNGSALSLFQLSVEGNKPDFDLSSLPSGSWSCAYLGRFKFGTPVYLNVSRSLVLSFIQNLEFWLCECWKVKMWLC